MQTIRHTTKQPDTQQSDWFISLHGAAVDCRSLKENGRSDICKLVKGDNQIRVDRCQSQPKMIKLEINKTLMLVCGNLTSSGKVSWKKGNQPVQQLGAKFEITQKNELKKFNVSLADEGNYSCEGVEKNNSTIRRNFTIVVLVQTQIAKGDSRREVNLDVPRIGDSGTADVNKFSMHGGLTSPSERIYVEEKQEGNETISVLIIQPVLYTDNGVYTCFAINEHSAVRNLTFVDVRYSPKSLAPSKSTQLVQWWEGAKVNLTCMADGNPPPKITWSYDADAEETDFNCSVEYIGDYYMNKTIARSTCWIQSTDNSSFQGGNYSCSAENAHGKILVQNFIVQRI
ncbi:hypothetical protein Btru_046452, partial [Bulinus truncatus]